jgi:hypothetical protein
VDLDPGQIIDDLLDAAGDLVETEDPFSVEILGAAVVSIGTRVGMGFEEALIEGFLPELESRGTREALTMLMAIGAVSAGQTTKAAWAAADRLVEAGVERLGWADELSERVTVTDCVRLADTQGFESMLACTFHRAGRAHSTLISVDDHCCGEATDMMLLEPEGLPDFMDALRATGHEDGLEFIAQPLTPAEFRWQVERALDARAVLDSEDEEGLAGPINDDDDDDDAPDYHTLAVLMRARMNALPAPTKPKATHADGDPVVIELPSKSRRRKASAKPTGNSGIAPSRR